MAPCVSAKQAHRAQLLNDRKRAFWPSAYSAGKVMHDSSSMSLSRAKEKAKGRVMMDQTEKKSDGKRDTPLKAALVLWKSCGSRGAHR